MALFLLLAAFVAVFVAVVLFVHWQSWSNSCSSSCDDSNRRNSNNDSFWRNNGYGARPTDVADAHRNYSNAHNPNHHTYGSYAPHPNYVDMSYKQWGSPRIAMQCPLRVVCVSLGRVLRLPALP